MDAITGDLSFVHEAVLTCPASPGTMWLDSDMEITPKQKSWVRIHRGNCWHKALYVSYFAEYRCFQTISEMLCQALKECGYQVNETGLGEM